MPPKGAKKKAAAQAPAAPPLDGCSVALSGSFPGYTQSALEQDFINALGGSLSKTVNASTTHLVTNEADFAKPSTKVKQAQSHDIHIVKFAWLEDCLEQSTKLNEDGYKFGTANGTTASGVANGSTNGAQKRSAVASDDDQSQPKPKKGKTATAAIANGSGSTVQSQVPPPSAAANGASSGSKPIKSIEKKIKAEAATAIDGETNIAKTSDINIPLDENCPLFNYRVYIDNDGLIFDASLNQTNASNNNNKFYRVQLLTDGADYKTWTRWGRVGDRGQSAVLGNGSLGDAMREFESKFKGKSGLAWKDRAAKAKSGKYTFIEKSYTADSDDDEPAPESKVKREKSTTPESKLDPAVQELMGLIFNQQYFASAMADLNYDIHKLPLGKLAKSTITKGYQALKDLSALMIDPSLATTEYDTTYVAAVEQLSNSFYSYIPHVFGRYALPVINTQDMLKREVELLDSLSDMKEATSILKNDLDAGTINALDNQFRGLNLDEMTPLKKESTEFLELKNYLLNTRGSTHNANYQVAQIFRIERQGEKERFEKSEYGGAPRDRRLLWHGSRATNFGGILSQGLRIAPPEAPVSGYMFGKGIYLADMSSKSANYCCAHISNGHALLLLCEAELGDPMLTLTNASYSASEDAKAKGMYSTWGQGMTGPKLWKDAGVAHPSLAGVKMPDTSVLPGSTGVSNAYLMYNEFITYDVAQVRLRYLFRVKM